MKPRFILPDIQFVEKSAQQIEADLIKNYENKRGIKLALADPRRTFLQALVPIILQQRVLIDQTGKQNLLAYADLDILKHIGSLFDVEQLEAKPAKTTIKFTLTTITQNTIPAGTRVTAGDGVFFVANNETTVNGVNEVDIEFECLEVGAIGNGYFLGEINTLVDPLQWVQSIENITVSEGGADEEGADSLAERIRSAPEKFSVAGPTGAYEYWSMTANQSIIDVYVGSPSPGVVEIRPLLDGGGIPGQEILDDVLAICSDSKIRPLTDHVQASAPEQVSYDINLTYWIDSKKASFANAIQMDVARVINDYKLWQKSKLGRSIDPSELITVIKNAGAKRVVVTSPLYVALEPYQVANDNLVSVTYGGLEND